MPKLQKWAAELWADVTASEKAREAVKRIGADAGIVLTEARELFGTARILGLAGALTSDMVGLVGRHG